MSDVKLPPCKHWRVVCLQCKATMRHCKCLPDKAAGEVDESVCEGCRRKLRMDR